jgi:hypothetical protein
MRVDEYAGVNGPTTGDRVRLADTGLVIEVESDSQLLGDEFLMGFGKTARDGMHLQARTVRDTCDMVISNVVLVDATSGVHVAVPFSSMATALKTLRRRCRQYSGLSCPCNCATSSAASSMIRSTSPTG